MVGADPGSASASDWLGADLGSSDNSESWEEVGVRILVVVVVVFVLVMSSVSGQ